MSNEKYISDDGMFVGDWTAEDAEAYFKKPQNQVKKLIINKSFSDISWIQFLTEVEELQFGHYSGSFDGSEIILDLGLLPQNSNRNKLIIRFECSLKSLLNWYKTDATELFCGELHLGEQAEDLGFIAEPTEPWGEKVEAIEIWKAGQTSWITLNNFQHNNRLKYYHDEVFAFTIDNINLDYFGSEGRIFSWLEKRYSKSPELAFTTKEVRIVGDGGYDLLSHSNKIFTLLKAKIIKSANEYDDELLALEQEGDEAIQKFANSFPNWPCSIHLLCMELKEADIPKIYQALRERNHTLSPY